MLTTCPNIDIQAMLVWLTLPFYDFSGFRSVAVNNVYKLQFFTFILLKTYKWATSADIWRESYKVGAFARSFAGRGPAYSGPQRWDFFNRSNAPAQGDAGSW